MTVERGDVTARRNNGRKRPKGYADWSPQAPARALLGQVEEILAEYADHLPLSVRQIFYRLVGRFDYEKTENAYERLSDKLVRARRARLIDFDAIRDDGVVTISPDWYLDVEDFWDQAARRARSYRRDREAGQPQLIELWCESAGMLPQLARVAAEFSIPVYSASGFLSLTATRQIADRALDGTRPTVLLHVGDLDPSGQSIFDTIASDAAAFVEADRVIQTLRIEPVRVALTAAQVSAYELPTAPAKATDGRSASWEGGTCQVEALAPDDLAAIVREAITSRMDMDRLAAEVTREFDDRRELLWSLPAGGTA